MKISRTLSDAEVRTAIAEYFEKRGLGRPHEDGIKIQAHTGVTSYGAPGASFFTAEALWVKSEDRT